MGDLEDEETVTFDISMKLAKGVFKNKNIGKYFTNFFYSDNAEVLNGLEKTRARWPCYNMGKTVYCWNNPSYIKENCLGGAVRFLMRKLPQVYTRRQ